MAKLVEEGCNLVECEQRRSGICRACEVTNNAHNRRYTSAISLVVLLAVVATPSTLSLTCAWVEVKVEDTQMALVLVKHLVCRYILVVNRNGHRAESDTEEAVCKVEDTLAGVIEREVATDNLLVERVLLLTHLLGIIPPVPRLELCILGWKILLEHLLHLGKLLLCLLDSWLPHLAKQSVYCLWSARHLVRGYIVSIRFISEHICLLCAEANHIVDNLLVIILVIVITTIEICTI